MMDRALAVQTERFRSDVKQAGEEVVFSTFPKKTLELQQLVLSTTNTSSPFHDANLASIDTTVYPPPLDSSDIDVHLKKRKISTDPFNANDPPSSRINQHDTRHARLSNTVLENKHVKHLHSIIKKECEELVTSIDKVRLWVTLAIPKIEDGDNSGTGVQEEILNELHRAQDCAYNLRDSARQHHLARAKICSKLIKYPYLEDYTSALLEHDEKQIFSARHHLLDIRDLYAALTDITQKNISKVNKGFRS
ncbi:proteasome activator pa28 [Lentinula edodes]|uniref:proteasome activator pa28 n=1 Tax=Lentinula edodes TaxID=5353 RepID=UPI001E8D067E|nr:proteasome activator pa28 [Lentinula edodes]KAH7870826.1 proteasome activator pa28 [Lentinula edodes]